MTRTLFTVGSRVYELTPELKAHFTDQLDTDEAIHAWFEGSVLWMAYETDDCTNPRCNLESVDVIEVFETLHEEAQDTLTQAGAQPVMSAPDGITADSNSVVSLKDYT